MFLIPSGPGADLFLRVSRHAERSSMSNSESNPVSSEHVWKKELDLELMRLSICALFALLEWGLSS